MIRYKGHMYREAADPQRDRAFRQEAAEAYKKLESFITNPRRTWDDIFTASYHEFVIRMGKVDPRYEGLRLGFERKEPGKSAGFYSPSQNAIVLRVITQDWLDKYVLDGRSRTFKYDYLLKLSWRSYFIHEFIHYLDSQRRKGPYKKKDKKEQGVEKTLEEYTEYFSSPEEFNAWYQQKMESSEKFLRTMHGVNADTVWDDYFKDWPTFKEYLEDMEFLEAPTPWPTKLLTQTYQRKLDKRLYQFYSELKQELFGK